MKVTTIAKSLSIAMLAVSSLYAQMNLGNFSSRSVRAGYNVSTTVDSLLIDTRINSGLATTRVTMVVHPGGYYQNYYYNSNGTYTYSGNETPLDSIEMTLDFTLPTDFVADSMWLWVNGKPVLAYIQDRALAASQYQQIVGTRRDPAILSYSGNGYYNLRIFPASSNIARKIAIQFHHTADDDSVNSAGAAFTTAALPVVYDTAATYSYYGYPKKALSFARLSCSAGDSKVYLVSMPGLGSGQFSRNNTLVLSGSTLWKLQRGTITGDDPSGTSAEYLWAGRDLKSTSLTAGFTAKLSDKGLTFLPEPVTRVIVLDMRTSVCNWNDYYRLAAAASGSTYSPYYYYTDVAIGERARKYAILAIQSYVDKEQSFNVVIAGKTAQRVFSSPVKGTPENKSAAIAAILASKPDASANTVDALSDAVTQAPDGVALLISDLYQPADYIVKVGLVSATSLAGRTYDATLRRIDSLANSVPSMTLFSISDNWKLGDITLKSGGYVIGGLRNNFSIPYSFTVVDGKRVMELAMPPLFGSTNPTGLTRLTISTADLDDLVYTLEGSGTGYFFAPLLRIAGRVSIEKFKSPMEFGIAGKLGGLRFTKNIAAATDYRTIFSSYRPDEDVQWAWRKSEWLAAADYQANAATIKAIGKEYHIVTRQTSLLALEPGMTLWNDTITQPGTPVTIIADPSFSLVQNTIAMRDMVMVTERIGGAPYSSYTYGNGFDIDSIPMETISGVAILPIHGKGQTAGMIRLVSVAGKKVVLEVPMVHKGAAKVALYNLTGRRIAVKAIDASQSAGTRFVWDLGGESGITARGQYVLQVTNGAMKRTFRVPLVGK
jgi:hypothetical protein